MTWTNVMLWAVTGLYAAQAVVYALQDKPQTAVILAGYVVANCGLIWAASA